MKGVVLGFLMLFSVVAIGATGFTIGKTTKHNKWFSYVLGVKNKIRFRSLTEELGHNKHILALDTTTRGKCTGFTIKVNIPSETVQKEDQIIPYLPGKIFIDDKDDHLFLFTLVKEKGSRIIFVIINQYSDKKTLTRQMKNGEELNIIYFVDETLYFDRFSLDGLLPASEKSRKMCQQYKNSNSKLM